jgi:hypothetical protein
VGGGMVPLIDQICSKSMSVQGAVYMLMKLMK